MYEFLEQDLRWRRLNKWFWGQSYFFCYKKNPPVNLRIKSSLPNLIVFDMAWVFVRFKLSHQNKVNLIFFLFFNINCFKFSFKKFDWFGLVYGVTVNCHFQQYFTYIVAVSFIGGGNWI